VIAPYDARDAKGLLKAAIRDPNPVLFLENEMLYGVSFDDVPPLDEVLPIGQALIRRSGRDVTVTAFSMMVSVALEAADILAQEGIDVEVIDLRTIRPLDSTTIVQSVSKTHRLVTLEEGWPFAGVGSEVAALMMEQAFDELDAPVVRVTGADVPMPYADSLVKQSIPQVSWVVEAIKRVCYRS
jgi:pyruvate dehydrogenase E1 component beta subunit